MSYFMSAVLGVVQGIAEFLPISSSGHLTLLQHFLGMPEPDNLFNILLHFATLLAVCVYYFQDVVEMIAEFFRGIAALFSRNPSRGNPPEARRLVLLVIVGTLPLFVVMLIKNQVEALGNYPVVVSCALLITGCILFFSDRMASGRKTARSATLKDALLVGVAQGFATVPGLSRSGCTISAGMAVGFDRKFAVRYSFLMSIPAILGANVLSIGDALKTAVWADVPVYLVGVAVSAVVGYLCIRLLRMIADKGRFGWFAYYCWAAGALTLILRVVLG